MDKTILVTLCIIIYFILLFLLYNFFPKLKNTIKLVIGICITILFIITICIIILQKRRIFKFKPKICLYSS